MPCYRVDLVLPAGVVVVIYELDQQSGHDDVDGADCIAQHV